MMGKLKDWAIGEGIEFTSEDLPTNIYKIELVTPTIETFKVESDVPLTRDEILSRVKWRHPKQTDFGNSVHDVHVVQGKIEKE
jgi:hypothetical protein